MQNLDINIKKVNIFHKKRGQDGKKNESSNCRTTKTND